MAFDYTKTVKRTEPSSGTPFRTPQALISGGVAQGVVLFDDDENHVGVDSNPMPTKDTVVGLTPFSPAVAASGIIKVGSGSLKGFSCTLDSGASTTRYLQFFDATSVPADTTVPTVVVSLEPGKTKGGEWDVGGYPFSTGISWCISDTEFTKTLSSDTAKLSGRRV